MASNTRPTLDQMILGFVDQFSNNPKLVDQVLRIVYALPQDELRSLDNTSFNKIVSNTQQQKPRPLHAHNPIIGILHPDSKYATEVQKSTPGSDPTIAAG